MDPYRDAARAADPEFCFYCGGPIEQSRCLSCTLASPERAEVPGPFRCARGHGVLVRESIGLAATHVCAGCRGMFVAGRDWDKLIAHMLVGDRPELSRVLPPPPSTTGPASMTTPRCPACRGAMDGAVFAVRSRIAIDICPAHGIWFDSVELVGVVEAVRRRLEGKDFPQEEAKPRAERMTQEEIDREIARMREISVNAIERALVLLARQQPD